MVVVVVVTRVEVAAVVAIVKERVQVYLNKGPILLDQFFLQFDLPIENF